MNQFLVYDPDGMEIFDTKEQAIKHVKKLMENNSYAPYEIAVFEGVEKRISMNIDILDKE